MRSTGEMIRIDDFQLYPHIQLFRCFSSTHLSPPMTFQLYNLLCPCKIHPIPASPTFLLPLTLCLTLSPLKIYPAPKPIDTKTHVIKIILCRGIPMIGIPLHLLAKRSLSPRIMHITELSCQPKTLSQWVDRPTISVDVQWHMNAYCGTKWLSRTVYLP